MNGTKPSKCVHTIYAMPERLLLNIEVYPLQMTAFLDSNLQSNQFNALARISLLNAFMIMKPVLL